MKKKILLVVLMLASTVAFAKSDYIFRQRVNWVKLEKGDSSVVALGSIRHPAKNMTQDQMEAMLLSVKIGRRFVIKKDIETADVFNSWEARKFAPYLVEALSKATSDQVVNFAVIHKRPTFILQNDRLTMGYLWVADDGIHFYFTKLFAKIEGDYEASAHIDKAIRRAKSLRISLEAGPGQKLSYNSPMEIIMDANYDFITQTANERLAQTRAEEEEMKGTKNKPQAVAEQGRSPRTSPTVSGSGNVADRLKQLDALKSQKLINEAEYQKLRAKILADI